jgi:hypothetical protein
VTLTVEAGEVTAVTWAETKAGTRHSDARVRHTFLKVISGP